jgi:hypothetical protein
MTRESITAVINNKVAEVLLCWCEGRSVRNARAKMPGDAGCGEVSELAILAAIVHGKIPAPALLFGEVDASVTAVCGFDTPFP